jgi:hypothetical protein
VLEFAHSAALCVHGWGLFNASRFRVTLPGCFGCWFANLSSYSNQGFCHTLCQDVRVETGGVVGGMLIPFAVAPQLGQW